MADDTNFAESKVKEYLDSFTNSSAKESSFPRVFCCKTSHSLYCKECCNLLVADDALPTPVRIRKQHCKCKSGKGLVDREATIANCDRSDPNDIPAHEDPESIKIFEDGPLRLPFDLHVILDDRRTSSTGLHAIALLGGACCNNSRNEFDQSTDSSTERLQCTCNKLGTVTLTDVEKLDRFEQSEILDNAMETYDVSNKDEDGPSTYLLFPCPGESVPLEAVSDKVKTLIVLDCKWTKSGVWRQSRRLRNLPKAHLSSPPTESHFWRWHNAGPGMMSTIEAIYYASLEVYQGRYKQLVFGSSPQSRIDDCLRDEHNSVHLLWLFGHQRQATLEKAKGEGKAAPCCEDGKEAQRALRRRKITWSPK